MGWLLAECLGIYTTSSLANTQREGYSASGACHAGFNDISNCVEIMIAKGKFSEDNIKVFGQCEGQHTLRNWQHKISDHENQDRSDISPCDGSVPIGLIVEIPPLSSMPPSHHTEDDQTVVKGMDPMSLTNSSPIINNQLRNLIDSMNDKMNNF